MSHVCLARMEPCKIWASKVPTEETQYKLNKARIAGAFSQSKSTEGVVKKDQNTHVQSIIDYIIIIIAL